MTVFNIPQFLIFLIVFYIITQIINGLITKPIFKKFIYKDGENLLKPSSEYLAATIMFLWSIFNFDSLQTVIAFIITLLMQKYLFSKKKKKIT